VGVGGLKDCGELQTDGAGGQDHIDLRKNVATLINGLTMINTTGKTIGKKRIT
jgi:hypothetical protein